MFRGQANRSKCNMIGSELIGHDPGWCPPLPLQELPYQLYCCSGITFRLHQKVQDLALIVHGTPQPMPFSTDHNDHFVSMPGVAGCRSSLPQVPANRLAKLKKPASDSFIGNVETALREVIFYISIAQSEPGVEPYRVADDLRWEAVALKGYVVHPPTLLQGRLL